MHKLKTILVVCMALIIGVSTVSAVTYLDHFGSGYVPISMNCTERFVDSFYSDFVLNESTSMRIFLNYDREAGDLRDLYLFGEDITMFSTATYQDILVTKGAQNNTVNLGVNSTNSITGHNYYESFENVSAYFNAGKPFVPLSTSWCNYPGYTGNSYGSFNWVSVFNI